VGAEKIALLHWADLFVLPTHHEVWGIALFEALAAGTPVVTTSQAEVRHELEAAGAAEIVGENAESLASALSELLRDRPALALRGAAASTLIVERHRSDVVGEQYVDFYGGLCTASQPIGSGPN
jgi:glycosyltransferase involved in cell wall biosynthesis